MHDKLFEEIIDNYDELKYKLLHAQTFDESHFGFPEIYYKIMETDKQRVDAFHKAFQLNNNFKDAVVCEIGVGDTATYQIIRAPCKKGVFDREQSGFNSVYRCRNSKIPLGA